VRNRVNNDLHAVATTGIGCAETHSSRFVKLSAAVLLFYCAQHKISPCRGFYPIDMQHI